MTPLAEAPGGVAPDGTAPAGAATARGWPGRLRRRLARLPGLLDPEAARYLAGYFRGDGWRILFCVLLASAQSLLFLPSLWLVKFCFDTAIPQGRTDLILLAGAGLVLLRVVTGGAVLLLRSRILRLVKGAVARMRADLVAGLYGIARDAPVLGEPDRLHTQIVHETERVDTLCNSLLSSTLPAFVIALVLGLVLLHLNPVLVALAALATPLLWGAGRLTLRRIRPRVRTFQRAFEEFSLGVQFVLRHMELTRIRAVEAEEVERQRERAQTLRRTGEAMAMGYALHGQVQGIATGVAGIALLVAGGVAIAHGTMSLGEFLAFYVAAGMLNGQVERLLGAAPELIAGNESLLTLLRLRRAEPRAPYRGTAAPDWSGALAVRRASFAYGGRTVLRDVSLRLAPGANIALIGHNGAGKTTLLHLLLGFSRPSSGQVEADGVPYDALDLGRLRRAIGMVPQHPTFFAGTVRENLAYGLPGVGPAEMAEAVRRACAEAFIARLPDGYDTPIGEGGTQLSGGERQRLAIARALLGRPRLLILDEPTNHLDLPTIGRVMEAIMADPDRPAILSISHDPAVVDFADQVFRLEAGRLSPARPARGAPETTLP